MRKVLIISRHFVPYYRNIGGVIRILKIAEFLRDRDVEVFVLAGKARREFGYFGCENIVSRIQAYYVKDSLQSFLGSANRCKVAGFVRQGLTDSVIQRIRHELCAPAGIFFITEYTNKALELINNYNIKNILITSPPHNIQMIGFALKKKLGNKINLIVDFRDSWNQRYVSCLRRANPVFGMISIFLERKVLENADYFICVSEQILKKINNRFFNISHKAQVIMRGFDKDRRWHETQIQKNKTFNIGYFGSLHMDIFYRNPDLFFESILKFNGRIKLSFYGDINIEKRWQNRLKGILEINKAVDYDKVFSYMYRMDALLVLHSQKKGADEVISGKLYDYMSTEKPIIVAGPKGMEVSRIVRQEGIGYVLDLYDQNDLQNKLESIYKAWHENRMVKYKLDDLKQYSIEYQYSKLVNILK